MTTYDPAQTDGLTPSFISDGKAELNVIIADPVDVSVVLHKVLQRHAASLVTDQNVELVSSALDVTGGPSGTPLQLSSFVDRQTRSLLFMHGVATCDAAPRIRLTAIYKIIPA
ncbi:MAG: hypothetical protein CME93_00080 [Hyphomonadaceae bacterium]|nr:hypothetical protein [Hyphomonadaceae bacterium]OUX95924.1 MAG: hypothetical protein CBB77_00080 [Hyphomonas sp. TMED17]CAI8320504.1 MAG: Uncharacterised protein [Hyphomonas sp. TMED17]